MKTKLTLFVAGGLSAMVLAAALAQAVDFRPLIVANPRGTLRLQQSLPCDQIADLTTDVAAGRIEMTPARGLDLEGGDKIFNLTRLTLFFNPFTVDGECRGLRDPHRVSEIGVQLTSSVFLRALPAGRSHMYRVRIPKEQVLLYESIVDNGVPKTHYAKPTEDVTGNISLDRQTMHLHIVIATRLLFRGGCDSLGRCLINEVRNGTQTADIAGAIVFPATAPPR
jgi:hypothetical protein